MADFFVGIDIGKSTIKAVQVSKSFRGGYRVTTSAIINIKEYENIKEALASLFENKAFERGRYALNFPSGAVSFRHVQLPFSDRKKIDQTLAFELESKLLCSIDDVFVDYLVRPCEDHGDVFAAIAKKSSVMERIEMMGTFDKKVDILDIDAFPVVSCLLDRDVVAGNGILLDAGEKSIMAIFFSAGRVLQARSFSKMSGAQEPDAEWSSLISQIKNTMAFLEWNGNAPGGFSEIFITGGGSLDNRLRMHLSEILRMPVVPIDVAAETAVKIDERFKAQWNPQLMNQALALAIRHQTRESNCFNLRAQIGKDTIKHTWILKNLKWAAAAIITAFLLSITELYLDYSLTSARVLRLKSEIKTVINQNAPEVTQIVDPLQQLNVKITESRKISRSMRNISSDRTFLDILLDISSLVSPATQFAVQSITYDINKIVLRGEALNFDAVDVIKKELSHSKYLSAVTINASNATKQGSKVEFEMHLTIRN